MLVESSCRCEAQEAELLEAQPRHVPLGKSKSVGPRHRQHLWYLAAALVRVMTWSPYSCEARYAVRLLAVERLHVLLGRSTNVYR